MWKKCTGLYQVQWYNVENTEHNTVVILSVKNVFFGKIRLIPGLCIIALNIYILVIIKQVFGIIRKNVIVYDWFQELLIWYRLEPWRYCLNILCITLYFVIEMNLWRGDLLYRDTLKCPLHTCFTVQRFFWFQEPLLWYRRGWTWRMFWAVRGTGLLSHRNWSGYGTFKR